MYLGKRNKSGAVTLVEVENGAEVKGKKRSESELYALGYKKACLATKGADTDTEAWYDYPSCLVQEWVAAPEEDPVPAVDELTDAEALDIITGRTAL